MKSLGGRVFIVMCLLSLCVGGFAFASDENHLPEGMVIGIEASTFIGGNAGHGTNAYQVGGKVDKLIFQYDFLDDRLQSVLDEGLIDQGQFAVRFNLGISLFPYITYEMADRRAERGVKAFINEFRMSGRSNIDQSLNSMFANDPILSELSDQERAQAYSGLQEQSYAQLESSLQAMEQVGIDQYYDRRADYFNELFFQQGVFGGAYAVGENDAIYVEVGKDRLYSYDEDEILDPQVRPEEGKRAGGTGPTGIVRIGRVFKAGTASIVDYSLTWFKDRPALMSFEQYGSAVASLQGEEYENYKQWYELDSVQAKLDFKNKKLSSSVAYATHGMQGSEDSWTLGIKYNFNKAFACEGVYYNGDRYSMQESVSTHCFYSINRWTLYSGVAKRDGYNDPRYFGFENLDFLEAKAGLNFRIINKQRTYLAVSTEYIDKFADKELDVAYQTGWNFGLNIRALFY